jgi:hypothetical protein
VCAPPPSSRAGVAPPVVLASAGYDCGSMAAGTGLPLDAALPVTEAVRTGRRVVRGGGPSWVALPLGGGVQAPGALLLSLTGAPPGSDDLERLEQVTRVLGASLRRAAGQDADTALLAAVTERLRTVPVLDAGPGLEVELRSQPATARPGGDVVACVPATSAGPGWWSPTCAAAVRPPPSWPPRSGSPSAPARARRRDRRRC